MSLPERVMRAMRHADIESQRDLAARVSELVESEVPPQTIHLILSGRTKHSGYLLAIAAACGVDPWWLAYGRGDMIPKPFPSPFTSSQGSVALPQHLRAAQRAAEQLAALPAARAKLIYGLIEALASDLSDSS